MKLRLAGVVVFFFAMRYFFLLFFVFALAVPYACVGGTPVLIHVSITSLWNRQVRPIFVPGTLPA